MIRLRSAARRGERGAVLVEAALVTPVVFLCIFGLMEMGLMMSTAATTSSAGRDGARYASAQFPPAASKLTVANSTRDEVERHLGALTGFDTPVSLWIYHAAANGSPINHTDYSACDTDCYRYTWNAATKHFVQDASNTATQQWTVVDACISSTDASIDSVGVYVVVNHKTATGFLSGRTFKEHSVVRLEPLPSNQCS